METAIVMWTAAELASSPQALPAGRSAARYVLLGVPIAVVSNVAGALQRVDETYMGFGQHPGACDPVFTAELLRFDADGACAVRDSHGYQHMWGDAQAALIDLLDRIVHGVLAELHKRGIYAIHAGALVYRGAALIIAGRSGQGKTTLTLGLLKRGLGLLSDEFAILDPNTEQIMPYRRSVHVRPGTPALIPELQFLTDRPSQQLGGGIEWSLTPADLVRAFPGCLAGSAPLRHVILLDGAPRPAEQPQLTAAPAALATIELLRGTWAASRDFSGGLARLGRSMNGVSCTRLRVGQLEATLDAILEWLERRHG